MSDFIDWLSDEAPDWVYWDGSNLGLSLGNTRSNVEYIRADHALVLVAAAYDVAASRVNQLSHTATATGNFTQAAALANEAEDIRDSTPADAQAALEARDKRIREEALRKAANVAHDAVLDHGDDQVQVRFAVLSMIEKEQNDDQE